MDSTAAEPLLPPVLYLVVSMLDLDIQPDGPGVRPGGERIHHQKEYEAEESTVGCECWLKSGMV